MDSKSILTLLILILLFIIIIKFFSSRRSSNKNLPPSPPTLPIIGNLHQLGVYPHQSLHSLAMQYGPIMLLHLGSEPTIVVSSVDMAREIMKTHDLSFANRPDMRIASSLLYDHKDLSLSPYGEYWRQMRSVCVLQLLSARKVKSFQSIREQEMAFMINKIEDSCNSSSPVDLSELFASFTNDVISRIALGRKYSEGQGGRKFRAMLDELGALLGVFNVGDFIPWLSWINYFNGLNSRVKRNFKEFDQFLDEVVDHHIALKSNDGKDQLDFVNVLLDIQNDGGNGICIGRDNIKAVVLDMFAGGADTTHAAIEWSMTELLKNPEAMKKAQEEIRDAIGGKSSVNEQDIDKFVFLKAVIKETLRLHPPLPILLPRQSHQDVKLGEFHIEAKSRVLVNAWAVGRDPKYWKSPEEFKPERFLDSGIDFRGQHFQFIPFGAGRRGCPGTSFAIANVEIALASLLYKFNWSLPGKTKPEDLDATESTGIAAHRKFPLVAVANPHFS